MVRILIADDQTQRYKALIMKISNLGISRDYIDIVNCAKDAESKLIKVKYDLFILDILLPLRSEDQGDSGSYSQDILFNLYNSDEFIKPNIIIGITGDKSTVIEELKYFDDYLWGVVEYSNNSSVWMENIVNAVNYINEAQSPIKIDIKSSVDIIILCALKNPELTEVLKLDWNWSSPILLGDALFYRKGSFQSGDKTYSVIAAHCDRMGMVSSALTTSKLINDFSPKIFVMVGICAGIKGEIDLGDIIFAECVWDYQNGKRLPNGEHELEPYHLYGDASIKSHVQLLQDDSTFFHKLALEYSGNKHTAPPKLHIGPIAVGSAVLADESIVASIVKQNRKVLGIEMEIYGTYYAAQNFSVNKAPKVFAIKSVCDYANVEKNDTYQEYASYNSAQTLKALMERYASTLFN